VGVSRLEILRICRPDQALSHAGGPVVSEGINMCTGSDRAQRHVTEFRCSHLRAPSPMTPSAMPTAPTMTGSGVG